MNEIRRWNAAFGALVVVAGLAACTADSPDPFDASAEIRPDLIVLQPSTVQPGSLVSVFFPDERMRGVHFVLESRHGEQWNLEYHLTSDWRGTRQPTSQKATDSAFGIEDIGFVGPEPDVISIPIDASPGEYRVCTGNSSPNICAELMIAGS
jgi:hypothetical protein